MADKHLGKLTRSEQNLQRRYILFRLRDLRFLKLYSILHPSEFDTLRFYSLQAVIDKFALSLESCIAHHNSKLETMKRKSIQKKIKQSEQRYANIVDHISQGIVICDLENKVIFINAKMEELTGYKLE